VNRSLPNPRLTRRDFLRLLSAAGGAVALAPLLKACRRVAPTTAPAASGEELLTGLDGLGIDDFFAESYRRWLVRDPENLTVLGLSAFYGVGNANLTEISDDYLRKTQALESGLLDLLEAYDRSAFSPDQSLTAEVYEWFLDDLERGHPFLYDDYPVSPMITSVHYNLYMLFTVYHPLNGRHDAEDYISRLSQVGTKLSQLVDGLQRREERGVILPAFLIPYVLPDLRETAQTDPGSHPYYQNFDQRLTGVTAGERTALLEQVGGQLETVVAPAYQQLMDCLVDQQSKAPNKVGVWQFDDGAEYYAQSLRRHTTTDLSAEEIHELGLRHVERLHAEIRTLFTGLGYPAGESIAALYERLAKQGGTFYGQAAVSAFEAAIREAETFLPQAFDILPRASVQVVGGEEGNYYMPPSFDGSRPGLFYALINNPVPEYDVKTLVYHETVPGHHLQISIAQEQTGLPALRQGMQFNAYVEGWALYAERLMWELGAYVDDPQGDLGRLRMEVYRAARLVVDTGLHSKRWSFDQAVDYLAETAAFPLGATQADITRYSVWPGQATSYYIGFLKILELRQKAMDALGGRFDLKAFHHILLVNGSLPLTILEELVDSYIGDLA
jgi:uncharacterized protein (DUF885 family)